MMTSISRPQDPPVSAALLRALAAHPDRIAHLVQALHRPVSDADTLLDLMSRAAREAVDMIPDVHWAGVTAQFDDDPMTTANTDQRVLFVDESQYELDDGPCLQAMRTDTRIAMTVEQVLARWPELVQAAVQAGVVSFLALPLHAHLVSAGSLNLYSGHRGGLRDPDPDLLTVLSEYLGRGLSAYADSLPLHAQAARIRLALADREVLNQAIGILMALEDLDQDQAWDAIQQRAETQQIPVTEYCTDLVSRH